ncbi:conjugation system SOS inhibitor PsiB [Mixta intestinalis]|uniref:Conjugation system SOS inhibitor PsiB n=1 Tax=Mixta intestinalis TaxID=1615494 RepID=A0A6P1Q770_9GAMM|nr:conjugation system SOS inhibitor PsiB [Mixta intestinalis]QHM74044.1 hypothetical protein C7M51_04405 [Mixta intestinalis]
MSVTESKTKLPARTSKNAEAVSETIHPGLDELVSMAPYEYEDLRDCGNDFRHKLNCAVLRYLHIPESWGVNAEYKNEYGGLYPVQCRFTPPGEEFCIALCSPGEITDKWLMILAPYEQSRIYLLKSFARFDSGFINQVLSEAEKLVRNGAGLDQIIYALLACKGGVNG